MNKYSQILQFEQDKIAEIQELYASQEKDLSTIQQEHMKKIESISADLSVFKEALNKNYDLEYHKTASVIQKETQQLITHIHQESDKVMEYAQKIAKIISE